MEQTTIENYIKIATAVLLCAGFVFGVLKYAQEKKRDFQKRFFEEQLTVYTEAVDFAATTSLYEKGTEDYQKAVIGFNRLYYGRMCIVEDKDVEGQMANFKTLLDKYEQENNPKNSTLRYQLQMQAIKLAHGCRNSCSKTWGIEALEKVKEFNDYSKT